MKVSASQSSLAKGLSIVGRAASSRTTMPVLSNILIEAKGDQIRLAATNREIGITCWIAAKVEEEGAITIPARLLSEFVNSLPPERVDMNLSVRTQALHLACARNTANMKGIDHYEFPLIPTVTAVKEGDPAPVFDMTPIAFDADTLSTAINRVAFAASDDNNRPTLTGIEFRLAGGNLTMAATDGFRLSVESHAREGDDLSVIVPAGSLVEVSKIAADCDGVVALHVGSKRNQMLFAMDGGNNALWQHAELVSELIDARFPDYHGTMPKGWETRCTVDTAQLLKAVRVALIFARDSANIVRFRANDKTLQLTANSAEMGDNVSDIDALVDGPEIEIAFNGKYLVDMLTQGDFGERVVMELTQPTRPGKFYGVDKEAEFVHVTMPMHLK